MYCNKCGNEINDNERFCKYCGAPIQKVNGQAEFESMDVPIQKQTRKTLKWFLLVPVFILIIAVEDEESQKTEIASEIETETIPTEEEAQEKPQEVISDESEQVEIPEIRMRDVKDVSASSYLSEKNIKHVPDRIMDGDTTTAWVEGVEGNGEGESITFTFGDLYVVSDIKIWNGYQKSEDLYYKNARTSELELEFSDGSTERISLQDMASGFQEFALERHVTSYVKVKIVSTYDGSKYEDTVISEIELR